MNAKWTKFTLPTPLVANPIAYENVAEITVPEIINAKEIMLVNLGGIATHFVNTGEGYYRYMTNGLGATDEYFVSFQIWCGFIDGRILVTPTKNLSDTVVKTQQSLYTWDKIYYRKPIGG